MLRFIVIVAALTTIQCVNQTQTHRRKINKDEFLQKLEREFPGYNGRPMPPELQAMIKNQTTSNDDDAEDCMVDFSDCMAVHKYYPFCAMSTKTNVTQRYPNLCEYVYRVCMDGEDAWTQVPETKCSHLEVEKPEKVTGDWERVYDFSITNNQENKDEGETEKKDDDKVVQPNENKDDTQKIETNTEVKQTEETQTEEIIKLEENQTQTVEAETEVKIQTTTEKAADLSVRANSNSLRTNSAMNESANKTKLFYRAPAELESDYFVHEDLNSNTPSNTSRIYDSEKTTGFY